MASERVWNAVSPQAFTTNGSAQGLIDLADTAGFRTKQIAYLQNTSNDTKLLVQIKRVLSPTLLIVGAPDNKIASWMPLDISAWTVAIGSQIGAESQAKNNVPRDDRDLAMYEGDPVCGQRVIQVDQYGNFYDTENPMPIVFNGSISIGQVEIVGTNGNTLEPNPDGSIKTVQLFHKPYDSVTATYPLATQEVYQTHLGGIAGPVQETATVNYTDSTKNFILNVAVV